MNQELILLMLLYGISSTQKCYLEDVVIDTNFLEAESNGIQEDDDPCGILILRNITGFFDTYRLSLLPYEITEIKIVNSRIFSVPNGGLCIFPNLTKIALEDNSIFPVIGEHFLENCDHITNVKLSNVSLTPKAFKGLSNTEVLNLKKVNVRHLYNDYMEPLNNLRLIRVEESEIQRISPPGLLCSSPNLRRLNLINNRIFPNFSSSLFEHCENLESLIISGINYPFLDEYAFNSMENLETLFITGIQIKCITSNYFKSLTSLRLLHLVENGVEKISNEAFSNLAKLEMFYLQYSNLENLERGTFGNLHSLEVLDLSGNKLKSFENFGTIPSLKVLDLSWNLIEDIDVDRLKKDLPGLNQMNFFGNAMSCMEKKDFIVEMKYIGHQVDVKGFLGSPEENIC